MAFDDVLYVIFGPNNNKPKIGVKYIHGGICSYHCFFGPSSDEVFSLFFLLVLVLNNLPDDFFSDLVVESSFDLLVTFLSEIYGNFVNVLTEIVHISTAKSTQIFLQNSIAKCSLAH